MGAAQQVLDVLNMPPPQSQMPPVTAQSVLDVLSLPPPEAPAPGWFRNTRAGLQQAATSVGGLLARTGLTPWTADELYEADAVRQQQNAAMDKETWMPDMLEEAYRSAIGSGVPAIAAGLAGRPLGAAIGMATGGPAGAVTGGAIGGPAAAITYGMADVASRSYYEGGKRGLKGADLAKHVGAQAGLEGVIAATFMKYMPGFEGLFRKGGMQALKGATGKETLKRVIKPVLEEMPEEALTEVLQNIEQSFAYNEPELRDPANLGRAAATAALAAAMMTGPVALAGARSSSRKDVADALGVDPKDLAKIGLGTQEQREAALALPAPPTTRYVGETPEGAPFREPRPDEPSTPAEYRGLADEPDRLLESRPAPDLMRPSTIPEPQYQGPPPFGGYLEGTQYPREMRDQEPPPPPPKVGPELPPYLRGPQRPQLESTREGVLVNYQPPEGMTPGETVSYADLKAEAKRLGVKQSGTKKDLTARVNRARARQSNQPVLQVMPDGTVVIPFDKAQETPVAAVPDVGTEEWEPTLRDKYAKLGFTQEETEAAVEYEREKRGEQVQPVQAPTPIKKGRGKTTKTYQQLVKEEESLDREIDDVTDEILAEGRSLDDSDNDPRVLALLDTREQVRADSYRVAYEKTLQELKKDGFDNETAEQILSAIEMKPPLSDRTDSLSSYMVQEFASKDFEGNRENLKKKIWRIIGEGNVPDGVDFDAMMFSNLSGLTSQGKRQNAEQWARATERAISAIERANQILAEPEPAALPAPTPAPPKRGTKARKQAGAAVTPTAVETPTTVTETQGEAETDVAETTEKKGRKKAKPDVEPGKGRPLGIVAPGFGRTILDDIADSYKAGAHKKFLNKIVTLVRPRGAKPEPVFDALQKKQGALVMWARRQRAARNDFKIAERSLYGRAGMPPDVEKAVEAVMRGADEKTLPTALRAPVQQIRSLIDHLSSLLEDTGMITEEMQVELEKQYGKYVHRAYRVHTDPSWNWEGIPQDVRDKYFQFLQRGYPEKTPDQIEGLMKAILDEAAGGRTPKAFQRSGSDVAKDLGITMKRRDFDVEFRDFLGEIHKPLVLFEQTVMKQAALLEQHRAMEAIREAGMGVFLFEEPNGEHYRELTPKTDVVIMTKDAEGTTKYLKIPAKKNPFAPLVSDKGKPLYTTPEIQEALFQVRKNLPAWMRTYYKANGLLKWGKTAGNPITHPRNYFANYLFQILQGNYSGKHMAEAHRIIALDIANKHESDLDRQILFDAAERQLIDTDIWAGENLENLRDAYAGDAYHTALQQGIKKAFKATTRVYQAGDNVHKISMYLFEIDRLSQALDGKTYKSYADVPTRIKDMAGRATVRHLPNYNYVNAIVKELRAFPLVGNFVSFPAEVIRVTHNTIVDAIAETKSTNPKIQAIGRQRLIGLLATTAIPTGAQALSMALSGVSWDEDEAYREFMAPWTKNGTVLYFGHGKDGMPRTVDVGYMDPWAFMRNAVIAAIRGEEWQDKLQESTKELLSPFLGKEILANAVAEAFVGSKSEGGDVYKDTDAAGEKVGKAVLHVLKDAEPGITKEIRNTYGSFQGETTYGSKITPLQQAARLTFGQRIQTLDIMNQAMFDSYTFTRNKRSIEEDFTSLVGKSGKVSEDALVKAYAEMERKRQDLYRDMTDKAAKLELLGKKPREIAQTLSAGMTENDFRLVLAGKYKPYLPSDYMLKKARSVSTDRLRDVRKAIQQQQLGRGAGKGYE